MSSRSDWRCCSEGWTSATRRPASRRPALPSAPPRTARLERMPEMRPKPHPAIDGPALTAPRRQHEDTMARVSAVIISYDEPREQTRAAVESLVAQTQPPV